jgi:sn-glycerol 3-phosphate transport system ATP-binding protein
MRLEIKQLQRELGVTALYDTHDQVVAMTGADRLVVMTAGRADLIGAPLEVYADPQTEFVAGFIGSPPTNFLRAGALIAGAPDGARLAVRPEHVSIAAPDDGRVRGRVLYAEALGAETLIHLNLADGDLLTVRQDGTAGMPPEGAEVGLAWPEAQEMFFGPDGRRLPRH